MDVKECLQAYTSLTSRTPAMPWYSVFTDIRWKNSGEIPITFDAELLETTIQEIIAQQGLDRNARLRDEQNELCKV